MLGDGWMGSESEKEEPWHIVVLGKMLLTDQICSEEVFMSFSQHWANALTDQLVDKCPSSPLANRTPARCPGSSRIHPEDVRGPEPRQWQNHLLTLHLRHRHREHPLCVRCCQGHHPPVESEGVQSGLIVPPRHRPSLPWWASEAKQEGLYFCGKQFA